MNDEIKKLIGEMRDDVLQDISWHYHDSYQGIKHTLIEMQQDYNLNDLIFRFEQLDKLESALLAKPLKQITKEQIFQKSVDNLKAEYDNLEALSSTVELDELAERIAFLMISDQEVIQDYLKGNGLTVHKRKIKQLLLSAQPKCDLVWLRAEIEELKIGSFIKTDYYSTELRQGFEAGKDGALYLIDQMPTQSKQFGVSEIVAEIERIRDIEQARINYPDIYNPYTLARFNNLLDFIKDKL